MWIMSRFHAAFVHIFYAEKRYRTKKVMCKHYNTVYIKFKRLKVNEKIYHKRIDNRKEGMLY